MYGIFRLFTAMRNVNALLALATVMFGCVSHDTEDDVALVGQSVSSPCLPGSRDYCNWMGVCNQQGTACVCDDAAHRLPQERCAIWHQSIVPPGQSCAPGAREYCNWMGVCNQQGTACVCDDSAHRLPEERCAIWHQSIVPPGLFCAPGTRDRCSWKGVCNANGTACQCDNFWHGPTCEVPASSCPGWGAQPDGTFSQDVCHRHGTCAAPGTCVCESEWFGNACQLKKPKIQLTSPQIPVPADRILSETSSVQISGRVSDDGSITSFKITVNGTTVLTPTLGDDGTFTQLVTLLTNLSQTTTINSVELEATDNTQQKTSMLLTVEYVSPSVPGELIVRFSPDSSEIQRSGILTSIQATIVHRIGRNTVIARLAEGASVEDAIAVANPPNAIVLVALPNVQMVHKAVPNDTMFGSLWGMSDGTANGNADGDIDAPIAWDISTGSRDVVVAVLDTGIQYDHEDLIDTNADLNCDGTGDGVRIDNIWLNERECCLVPPCASLCLPKRPIGDVDACPNADLNGDGCPGNCGADDDADGLTDFADPDVQRIFSNGADDDGDGLRDEAGPGGVDCNTLTSIPAGTPGTEDCDGAAHDDDENGYVDDCRGWDFSNRRLDTPTSPSRNDNDPDATDTSSNDHGTHVAGTVGAIGGNCKGVAGASHRVRIMPLKVMRNGTLDLGGALAAFAYAAENGAMVTNSSWSRFCRPTQLNTDRCPWGAALTRAEAADLYTSLMLDTNSSQVLHVFAAGNESTDLDTTGNFYFVQQAKIPNKILVAATGADDRLATSFSNFGQNTVLLGAPGVGICSSVPTNAYSCAFDGTSMASPHVAGVAGLVLAVHPELRGDPSRLIRHLQGSVESGVELKTDNALDGLVQTNGRINAGRALGAVAPAPTLFVDDSSGNLPSGIEMTTERTRLVDVDDDGDLDLFSFPCHFADVTGQPQLMLNDGTGRFTSVVGANWPTEAASVCGVAIEDVDGDGDTDVVTGGFSNFQSALRRFGLYINDGTGRFTRDATGRIPDDNYNTRDVELCDVDGDGDLDLFASNAGSAPMDRLFINDGTGIFVDETAARFPGIDLSGSSHNTVCAELTQTLGEICAGENGIICPVCADPSRSVAGMVARNIIRPSDQADCLAIRAKVAPELMQGNCEGNRSLLLVNDGSGNFTDGTPAFVTAGSCEHDVDAADIDGDGDLDLVAARRAGGQGAVWVAVNGGGGDFLDETVTRLPAQSLTCNDVLLSDFDVDGDLDIVFGTGDPNVGGVGTPAYLRNNGLGYFSDVSTSVGMPTAPYSTEESAYGDIDGDGDVDLIVGNWGIAMTLLRNTSIP